MHQVGSFLGTSVTAAGTSTTPTSSAATASPAQAVAKPAKQETGREAEEAGQARQARPRATAARRRSPAAAAPAAADNLMTAAPVDPKVTSGATGYKNFASPAHPLFGDGGPIADDVAQGDVGDCFFLATLASVAKVDPNLIRQSVVDLGDGTYAVAVPPRRRRRLRPRERRPAHHLVGLAWRTPTSASRARCGSR